MKVALALSCVAALLILAALSAAIARTRLGSFIVYGASLVVALVWLAVALAHLLVDRKSVV